MASFFHTYLYLPIYNLLFFIIDIVPGGDVGLAVVIATLIVKIALMPLTLSAAKTQKRMKHIEPQLKEIREKYKDSKEEQAKRMMALYKEHGVRPVSSILGAFIQLPIVFTLYYVTRHAVNGVNPAFLYGFVHAPAQVSPLLLGLFPVAGHSLVLAILAAGAQFLSARFTVPLPAKPENGKASAGEDFGRMMALQARFMLPVVIGVAAYSISGAVAIYFITSSLFTLVQEFVVRRMKHPMPVTA